MKYEDGIPFYEMPEGMRKDIEEKEQRKQRDEQDLITAVQQEQQHLQGQVLASPPDDRYNEVIQAAQRRVMGTLDKLEARLERREIAAESQLTTLTHKRPGRLKQLLTNGNAGKRWNKAINKQNATLFNIRKNKSRVKTVRTQASNFKREMDAWIRKRALRIDRDAVLVHDAAIEQRQQEEHRKRIDLTNEMDKRREVERGNEKTMGNFLEKSLTM